MKLNDIINDIQEISGIISESSLSRLWTKINNSDFCIISGYRFNLSASENKSRNAEILKTINAAKMGGYILIGHWQEAPDGKEWSDASPDELNDSVEESIMIPKPVSMQRAKFIEMCVGLCKKYNQDAIIIGLSSDGMYFYDKNGKSTKFASTMTMNKVGQAYSQMKRKKNIPFIFEGLLRPDNNISRQLYNKKGILWI